MSELEITPGERMNHVTEAHNRRVGALDPLLAPVAPLERNDPGFVQVRRGGGAAEAVFRLTCVDETAPDAVWGALRQHTADVRLAGDDRDRVLAFESILDDWLSRITAEEAPGDWESSARIMVPTRDTSIVNSLYARGFAPTQIRAVRLLPRERPRAARAMPIALRDGTVRQARQSDAERLGVLDAQLLRLDAQFAGVSERQGAAATFAREYRDRLRRAPDTTWVLEREGLITGYIHVMPNEDSPEPDALALTLPGGQNLVVMYLEPTERGSGTGAEFVDIVHRALDAAATSYIALSYAVANPRSGPFWSRAGYRPVMTEWQRRPARLGQPGMPPHSEA